MTAIKRNINKDIDKAKELSEQRYKWNTHTQPGTGENTLILSQCDKFIAKAFG